MAGPPRARIGPGDRWDRGPLNVSDDWKQWRFETIFYTHYCNSGRGSYFEGGGGGANLGDSGGMLPRKILKFRASEMARNGSFFLK